MNLETVWQELGSYDGKGAQKFELTQARVQFYMGAMEIPMVAVHPEAPFHFSPIHMNEYADLLMEYGLELDCVEEGANYKINFSEDGLYLGRLTSHFLKLHAQRIQGLGWEAFSKIVNFHLNRTVPVN